MTVPPRPKRRMSIIECSNADEADLGEEISDASGTADLGNAGEGVLLGSSNNFVGGVTSGTSNNISFDGLDGVGVFGSTSTGNRIERNSIF